MKQKNIVVVRTFLAALITFVGLLFCMNLSQGNRVPIEHSVVKDAEIGSNIYGHPRCMTGDSLVLKDPITGDQFCRSNSVNAG